MTSQKKRTIKLLMADGRSRDWSTYVVEVLTQRGQSHNDIRYNLLLEWSFWEKRGNKWDRKH